VVPPREQHLQEHRLQQQQHVMSAAEQQQEPQLPLHQEVDKQAATLPAQSQQQQQQVLPQG
jgi:hypothetical protein